MSPLDHIDPCTDASCCTHAPPWLLPHAFLALARQEPARFHAQVPYTSPMHSTTTTAVLPVFPLGLARFSCYIKQGSVCRYASLATAQVCQPASDNPARHSRATHAYQNITAVNGIRCHSQPHRPQVPYASARTTRSNHVSANVTVTLTHILQGP